MNTPQEKTMKYIIYEDHFVEADSGEEILPEQVLKILNSHAALVEALREMVLAFGEEHEDHYAGQHQYESATQAKKALKAVEG